MLNLFPLRESRRVYCAGPLFNESERREMSQIAQSLAAAGFDPFVPHADGMEFAEVHPYLTAEGYDAAEAGQIVHRAVFALDVYQVIVGCGSLVLNMNGRVPDEGAVAEAAMAWAMGKPLVIYKRDARSKIEGRDNPLLVGLTDFEVVDRIERLGQCLAARRAQLQPDPAWQVPCPPHLRETLSLGERMWRRLQTLGDSRPAGPVAAAVLDLFGEPVRSLRETLPLGE